MDEVPHRISIRAPAIIHLSQLLNDCLLVLGRGISSYWGCITFAVAIKRRCLQRLLVVRSSSALSIRLGMCRTWACCGRTGHCRCVLRRLLRVWRLELPSLQHVWRWRCIRGSILTALPTLVLLQYRSEGIQLLLQLGNTRIRLLLTFPTWCCNDALPAGLLTSATWYLWMLRVLVATNFQPTARLTGSWTLGILAWLSRAIAFFITTVLSGDVVVYVGAFRTGLVALTARACRRAMLLRRLPLRRGIIIVWLRRWLRVCAVASTGEPGWKLMLLRLLLLRGRWWRRRGGKSAETRIDHPCRRRRWSAHDGCRYAAAA